MSSAPVTPAPARKNLLGQAIGFFVIGVLTIAFAISFAAIVYSGPMSGALAQGIAHTLAGGALLAIAGMGIYSFHGTITHPQDVTAILLGSAVASFFASGAVSDINPDLSVLAPTVGVLVALAALAAGIACYTAGALRLGGIVRYIPHPVIGGFLAATGYLLTIGALGMAIKSNVDITNLHLVFTADLLPKWGIWIAAGLILALVNRATENELFLPISLTVLFAGFYASLPLLGIDLARAGELGLLLGPFESANFLGELDPTMPASADWGLIALQIPTLLAVMVLAVIGTLLNSSGLEMALNRDLDVERDLRASGVSNLASSLLGGLPGYPAIGEPLLAQKLGLAGKLPAISAAVGCASALFFGAQIFGLLPIGVFATLVAFLGFDLLIEWIWDMRRKLSRADYTVVLAIVAVAAFAGFLLALVAGLIAAVVLFLIAYGRINVVRGRTTLAERRSRVERPLAALTYLAKQGRGSVVFELEGYLFFGTANALRKSVKAELAATPDRLILDFRRVVGMDISAIQSLAKVAKDVHDAGPPLILANLSRATADQLRDICPSAAMPQITATLDVALEQVETQILADWTDPDEARDFLALVKALDGLAALSGPVQRLSCAKDMLLVKTGSTTRELFLVLDGTLRAEVTTDAGDTIRVAQFQSTSIVGELAHYAGVSRTANIITETPAQLLRIDLTKLEATDPALAGKVHLLAAQILARRVVNMTTLVRSAGL